MRYNGNVDSTVNQRIKREFVDREVLCCDTSVVEYILRQSYDDYHEDIPFTYDDIENLYPNNQEDIDELEEKIQELEDSKPEEPDSWDYETDQDFYDAYDAYEEKVKEIDAKIEELEDEVNELEYQQERPQEVFEWWRITSYLFHKLRDKGEVVLEGPNGYYWGRCCTGQAILLDWVISEICADNEILEGQEYDWSKRMQL